jgi:hypothetical protein
MPSADHRQPGRFRALISAEARKLRTVPSIPLLAVALALLTFLAVAVPIGSGDADPRRGEAETIIVGPRQSHDDRIREILGAGGIAGIVAMLLASVAVAGDARHGTAVQSVLLEPRRARVASAHVLLHVMLGLVLGFVAAGVIAACAPALLARRGIDLGLSGGQLAAILAGVVLQTAFFAGLGATIGLLIPSQPAAVAVIVFGVGIVEPLVSAALGPLRDLSLSGASDALLRVAGSASPLEGVGVLAAWLLLAGAAGAAALTRRELR